MATLYYISPQVSNSHLHFEENCDFNHYLPQSRYKTEDFFFKNSLFYSFYASIIYDTPGISGISFSSIYIVPLNIS